MCEWNLNTVFIYQNTVFIISYCIDSPATWGKMYSYLCYSVNKEGHLQLIKKGRWGSRLYTQPKPYTATKAIEFRLNQFTVLTFCTGCSGVAILVAFCVITIPVLTTWLSFIPVALDKTYSVYVASIHFQVLISVCL